MTMTLTTMDETCNKLTTRTADLKSLTFYNIHNTSHEKFIEYEHDCGLLFLKSSQLNWLCADLTNCELNQVKKTLYSLKEPRSCFST